MKLMLLIIPTIQKIVNPAANAPLKVMTSPPNGLAMNVMLIPSATAKTPRPIWPASCQRARRSRKSSIAPSAAAAAPPTSSAVSWLVTVEPSGSSSRNGRSQPRSWVAMKASATAMKAVATAIPPPRGIGTVLTRRASGRSTIP